MQLAEIIAAELQNELIPISSSDICRMLHDTSDVTYFAPLPDTLIALYRDDHHVRVEVWYRGEQMDVYVYATGGDSRAKVRCVYCPVSVGDGALAVGG